MTVFFSRIVMLTPLLLIGLFILIVLKLSSKPKKFPPGKNRAGRLQKGSLITAHKISL
jgi:hypothetical protein